MYFLTNNGIVFLANRKDEISMRKFKENINQYINEVNNDQRRKLKANGCNIN